MEQTRKCSTCKKTKPLNSTHFKTISANNCGFGYRCKMCEAIVRGIKYRKEKILSYSSDHVVPYALQERAILKHALLHCHGNVQLAAKILRIAKMTLYRRLKDYGIAPKEEIHSRVALLTEEINGLQSMLPNHKEEKHENHEVYPVVRNGILCLRTRRTTRSEAR